MWRPSGETSARPSAGNARIASMKRSTAMMLALELAVFDDHWLVARFGEPFLDGGKRPDRVRIELRLGLQLDLVGTEAAHHGRIHRIGDGEMPEQEFALPAEALAAIAPERGDAVDVGLRLLRHAAMGEGGTHIHRQMTAKRGKARMHLGRGRACDGAGLDILRPEPGRREDLE